MPKGKAIKSARQFRFMQAAAHNKLNTTAGPSPEVAKKLLHETSEERKSKFAKAFGKR